MSFEEIVKGMKTNAVMKFCAIGAAVAAAGAGLYALLKPNK